MKKRVLVLVLLSLVLVSMISSFVIAPDDIIQTTPPAGTKLTPTITHDSSKLCEWIGIKPADQKDNFFCERMKEWEGGINWSKSEEVDIAVTFMKYFLLILIIILVWSGMSYAGFPKNVIGRIILACVAGFLMTFLVSTGDILASLTSFSAAGVAFIIFFPIFVLALFTILVAAKADPAGIFIQRILWIIYGVYLILRAGSMALYRYYLQSSTSVDTGLFSSFMKLFMGDASSYGYAAYISPATITILFIVGIMVLVIMGTKGNEFIRQWIGSEKRKAELESWKARLDRFEKGTGVVSDMMEEGTKKK